MAALLLSIAAGVGVYFLYTATVLKHRSLVGPASLRRQQQSTQRIDDWFAQAGIPKSKRKHVAITVTVVGLGGGLFGWMLFGGVIAPLIVAVFAGSFPATAYRQRRNRRRTEAADTWPRMIEEIRLLCGSLGRPIPQALLEVGKRGPEDMRPAFHHAEREWLISTDFTRTTHALKEHLADPTADIVCETLLLAHSVGGNDVDRRLAALAEDRQADLHCRKDARSKQAGVKFARRFVLIVPVGMAFAGLSIGNGRAAYATSVGQLGVAVGLFTLAACWFWAGHLIRMPEEKRVFRA
jgi:tight adherence protein B